ncbi:MAG: DUF1697 domain-containing protein [Candidatus Zixiibacteriota bacterium]
MMCTSRYIAFLRAINVGGYVVKMERLRELFESLGFTGVETLIASGNVIFTSDSKAAALERKIESCLMKALGYEVATFVRTDAEVAEISRYQPFADSAFKTAVAFNVGFLAEPLGREGKKMLMTFKTAIDDFHVNGREVYWLCKKKQSESTFSNVAFERVLKTRCTFHGLSTVQKLAAKYPPTDKSAQKWH